MKKVALGRDGPSLPVLGLGCMGMSDFYGPADRSESIATIHAALDAGMSVLDTGDFYGVGHNELLVREALRGRPRENVFIAVKFGALRTPDRKFIGIDTRPRSVRNFLAYTLERLGTDYVDLYQPARIAPDVPVEETVGAIGDMIDAGYVRHLGLSEAGADTVRRAHRERPVSWLQIEYSLASRGIEDDILPTLRELGIGLSAYGVLSRGLLSGRWQADRADEAPDFRSALPRFTGDNVRHNLAVVDGLRSLAQEKACSVAQLAIAWVLARGEDIIPLVGARRRDRLTEALGALDVVLSPEDMARIETLVPPGAIRGQRYAAEQMAALDSERGGGEQIEGRSAEG